MKLEQGKVYQIVHDADDMSLARICRSITDVRRVALMKGDPAAVPVAWTDFSDDLYAASAAYPAISFIVAVGDCSGRHIVEIRAGRQQADPKTLGVFVEALCLAAPMSCLADAINDTQQEPSTVEQVLRTLLGRDSAAAARVRDVQQRRHVSLVGEWGSLAIAELIPAIDPQASLLDLLKETERRGVTESELRLSNELSLRAALSRRGVWSASWISASEVLVTLGGDSVLGPDLAAAMAVLLMMCHDRVPEEMLSLGRVSLGSLRLLGWLA